MAFELEIFADERIDADYIEWLIDERSVDIQQHFNKLWEYYSNRAVDVSGLCAADRKVNESGRCYVQAQEYGLPARITGLSRSAQAGLFSGEPVRDVQRKEVVIENDIGWRINAAVDFLFGKTISFASKAADAQRRAEIETLIKAMFAANGGIGFFQDMAVLGSIYGFVDCMVRPGDKILSGAPSRDLSRLGNSSHISNPTKAPAFEDVLDAARAIDLELIEAPIRTDCVGDWAGLTLTLDQRFIKLAEPYFKLTI